MPLYATKLVPNITKVGSPTISNTNVVSGFSTSKYFTALSNINASVFDIRFKIQFSASTISGGQKVFCVGTQANEEKDLFVLINNAGTYLYIKHKSSQFAGFNVINNGYCYFKFVSDGVTLSVYTSTTGFDSMTLNGTTPLDTSIQGPVYFGCEPNYTSKGAFGGSVYLEDTQITVNNTLWWDATKYGFAKIKDLYKGSIKIKKLYKGSTLVYSTGYPSGTVLLEKSVAGTYTLTVDYDCTIHVDLVGGGSGGNYNSSSRLRFKGGSGAYISGNMSISAGTYQVVVGAGSSGRSGGSGGTISAGGDSTFTISTYVINTAGGAPSYQVSNYSTGSTGGSYSIASSGLSGQNGSGNNTTGWINGYGAGGNNTNSSSERNGKDGYCKIVTV